MKENLYPPSSVAIEQQQPTENLPPAPPLPHRRPRPRVREVSSRFLSSPLVPSNNATPAPTADQCLRSKPRRQQPEHEPPVLPSRTETAENIPQISRSLDSSPLHVSQQNHRIVGAGVLMSSAHRKMKLVSRVKSEGIPKAEQQQQRPSRPDTPIINRIVPSRYGHSGSAQQGFSHRPTATGINGGGGGAAVTAAAKLLQEATSRNESNDDREAAIAEKKLVKMSRSKDDSSDLYTCSSAVTQQGGSCPNSPVCGLSSNKTRAPFTEVRSSMPEEDMLLPTMSTRPSYTQTGEIRDDNFVSSKFASSPACSRSLNFQISSGENFSSSTSQWPFHTTNNLTRTVSTPCSKSFTKNQVGNFCLPPHPSCLKFGADARKGKKLSSSQEDVHSLKMLHNHYLQWRFANAKAEASMRTQRVEAERQFKSLANKLAEMRDTLMRKDIELAVLQRIKTLSTVVESQMPYLEQWSAMEESYSASLSSVIEALLNLSVRLPISSQIKVDVIELMDTFDSALKVMEMIASSVKSFTGKAEETESMMSDIARVVGGERALIEECGYSLFNIYTSQVEECSLRGHLFQLSRSNKGFEGR